MIPVVLVAALHLLVMALGAPLVTGLIRTMKARLMGRQGPVPWQPYRDLAKLFGKEVVISATASWVFRATPYVLTASMLTASLLVPLVAARPGLGRAGGIIAMMYVLLLGTFFLALAGLDSGSAFGGMGSSRAMAVAALAEPTLIVAVFALSMSAGTTNLGQLVERLADQPGLLLNPGHLLAFAAVFIVMLAETGRLPVDNPATHLELTMIHEAMILEYSGRYLALIEWASAMKLLLFMALLGNLFVPWGMARAITPWALLGGLGALAGKVLVLAGVVAMIETAVAKLRLFRVPELLAGSFALALLSVISVLLLR